MKSQTELSNSDMLDDGLQENFSEFRFLGIGKRSAKQEKKYQQKVEKKLEKIEKKAEKKAQGKGFFQQVMKFNPVAALGRAGVLAGARVNFSGMSVRLYPAFITEEEAKKKKIKVTSIPKAKAAWEKTATFYRNIGGNPDKLKSEIMKGYDKPVFKTKASKARTSSFSTEYSGFVVETGAITAGIGLLTTIISKINQSGADKNPYEGGSDSDILDAESGLPPINQQEVDAILAAAAEDAKAGLPLDDGDETILGMPAWAFWTGTAIVGVLAIVGIVKLLKK